MKLATVLSGQAFIFRSLKEVLAKANELKSGDVLAGVAASSDLERIAAKEVLSQLLLSDLRNHPVVPYEEDEVTRINQDGIDETVYQRIKNWTVAELREYILSHETRCVCRLTAIPLSVFGVHWRHDFSRIIPRTMWKASQRHYLKASVTAAGMH